MPTLDWHAEGILSVARHALPDEAVEHSFPRGPACSAAPRVSSAPQLRGMPGVCVQSSRSAASEASAQTNSGADDGRAALPPIITPEIHVCGIPRARLHDTDWVRRALRCPEQHALTPDRPN